jgi:hypothetical protein
MVFENEEQVIALIKENLKTCDWIKQARDKHKVYNALVNGVDFHEVLINRIEKIESADRAEARKRYSKDIRDMFKRVMKPRLSVFNASGGSVRDELTESTLKDRFEKSISHFRGQKSIKKYLSENFFDKLDIDPNGVIFLEYILDKKIYPTYKSIDSIRKYRSNGQLVEYIIFEPQKVNKEGRSYEVWRVVDDVKDYRIKKEGDVYEVIEELTFEHPFGKVPCAILSDIEITGTELRKSPLDEVEELSKEYARDKSILTIYKFQHGFPRHWRYIKECRACHGTGKNGQDICGHCDGKGEIRRNDITDVTTLALPREDDQIVTPNVEGFTSPDLETWRKYEESLVEQEDRIFSTSWGTQRVREAQNETATGRFIDVQPVMTRLDSYTDNVEWVHNMLADWVENWVYNNREKESEYHVTYGRRFIIESPDTVIEKYSDARSKGDPVTILDKLLDEYILSKYQNNPDLLSEMQKKKDVEPYIHQSIKEVADIFGSEEAYKKALFVDFWEQADKTKDTQDLKREFESYVNQNRLNINTDNNE